MTIIEFQDNYKDEGKYRTRESRVPAPIPVPDYIHRKWIERDKYTGEWIGSDIWRCDHCPNYGDVWFMAQHICKGSRKREKEVEAKILRPLSLEKICPDCNKSINIYDRTHHLVCKEEDRLVNQESIKRLLKKHAPQSTEQDYQSNSFANTTNRWSKRGLRARYIASLRKKARDLSRHPDFQNQKALLERLEEDQYYWILYINGQRIGPVEKATREELSSWDPNQPDGIDHSREVKG